MKDKNTHSLFIAALVVMMTLVMAWPAMAAASSTVTVTDFQDRSVTVKAPAKRIILFEGSKLPEIAALLGEDFVDRIVGWDNDFPLNGADGYAQYLKKFPSLGNVPDVGSLWEGTMSVEKVITLNPDVVIAHKWMYMFGEEATRSALSRLDQAGIPVVFLDFYIEPLVNSAKSMVMLGKILGCEERAAEVVDFYNKQLAMVSDGLKNAKSKDPSVYIECTARGWDVYGLSYGDLAWGGIVKTAGGDNIGTALLGKKAKAISPEYLLTKDPEMIILTGRSWKNPNSEKMGYAVSIETARATAKPFLERAGWDSLKAVEGKKVYSIYHGFCYSIFNFTAVQALAKWFHPDAFESMDPETSLKEFHDRFLPVEYDGTFMFSYF